VAHPDPAVFRARVGDQRSVRSDRALAVTIALYANAVRARPFGDLLDLIPEPAVGDPVLVRYGARTVSEDLCHSVEEYSSIVSGLPSDRSCDTIVEIGAGYGRLAYVFLRASRDVRYHIVDIPPALFVAQWYLTSVLPDVPVFRFRQFRTYEEVADEMAGARLVFLEPQQLALLPDDYADLAISISTLHEMVPDQVSWHLATIDRLCRVACYLKQWRHFYNETDRVLMTRASYRLPGAWEQIFDRAPLAPRSFFEALYVRELDAVPGSRAVAQRP
jgi:putative sugar O-methyltransferase